MKNFILLRLLLVALVMASLMALCGCAAKGYVTAAVQTVIGLDVSENPQTQVPHVRFGFVRSQYYYIPTGKAQSGQGTPGGSGKASETPELVSEVYVNSKFLQGIEIKERFAVGKEAVTTPAAERLFAPAVEASKKYPPIESRPEPEIRQLKDEISKICGKDKAKKDSAEKWIKKEYPAFKDEKHPLTRFLLHPPSQEALERLLQELEKT